MRVLMISRPNGLTMLGGDTVQLQRTAASLRNLGVEVAESFGSPPESDLLGADVVHLFNLQTPDFTLAEAERSKHFGKPIALSTIFWDFGAEQLLARSKLWSKAGRILGRRVALRLAQFRVEHVAREDRNKLRRILELADVWLPNSHAEAQQLRKLTNVAARVQVIPNAVDPERHRPDRDLPLPSRLGDLGLASKGYGLTAARIEPDKNQLEFCLAIRELGRPWVLCGPTPEPEYAQACREAGALILEALYGDELDSAMLHAKVHALPSYRETPGLASLEAAALGCAIVSTSVGSVKEYFLDEAEYCEPWSRESMRGAVQQAWGKGPTLGLSERIRTQYNWQEAARLTLEAYRTAAATASKA